jgi:RNA polymerase sigma factor (sigma-70 family)
MGLAPLMTINLASRTIAPLTDCLMALVLPDSPLEADSDRLLERIAYLRDKSAFSALFEHFAPRLNAYMRKMGADSGVAEELVQETMLLVWNQAHSFDPAKATAATWVFTIARNKRIDFLRRLRRPEVDWSDPALVPASTDDSTDAVYLAEQQKALGTAIATLPKEQADLLRLAYYEDLPHVEIARKRGLPLGTVKSRLRLAMDKLRHHIVAREV